ncbi:RNA exonuclease 1 homolog [Bicyclus anynana]|uniref:RNA exonuclease 1 homolog n=1 Tax=Bicyclus anynana TaxID=110368 RepID=A0A6J1NCE0_BICAN|nr:RNA exonuclease 1 homolog [Bicyclus anynana]
MLPSTGYFKGINCPFYDSGFCERPYCHFRHVKKEPQNNDGIESGAILQKLVSAAVQKVLQQTETGASTSQNTVTNLELNAGQPVSSKVTYNPTPIAELNKINHIESENIDDNNEQKRRHIPVPYTPRKPASIPIKRPVDTNGTQVFTYLPPAQYNPGSEKAQLDPYTPKGSTESGEKYLPGTEKTIPEYKPKESQNSTVNYVPSDKTVSKKKILEYKPAKVKSVQSSVTYQPTPRSLVPCFSSDEEEPDVKKRKLSGDLNGLDDLGPEFDILDQILDEEKTEKPISQKNEKKEPEEKSPKTNTTTNECVKPEKIKSDKEKSSKTTDKKSRSRSVERKEKRHDKDKNDRKSSDKKSNQKSSSKDKNRHEKNNKSDKKSHSHSKHSKNNSSKPSKHENNNDKQSNSKSHKSHSRSKESKDKKDKRKDRHESSARKITNDEDNHNYDDNFEEELNELSESDEETIALQCKKIFEEYVPTKLSHNSEESKDKIENEPDVEEYIPTKKRISRTVDKNIKIIPKAPIKPDFKVSAAQAMAERLAKVREFHASKSASESDNSIRLVQKPEVTKAIFNSPPPSSSVSKIRIAHVPYASTMLTAKKVIAPSTMSANKSDPSSSCTITQTVKKGTQRVAHIPSEKFIDRPGVLEPLGSKIPANIRSTYLNMMIDNCLKIYISATDAYARAQQEELATSKKCSTVQIYKNSAVLAISRLKKEVLECNGVKKSGCEITPGKQIPGTVSKSNTGSWSIESKIRRNFEDPQQFTGAKFYDNIKKWILTEEQLIQNGFPRPHSSGVKGRAIIHGQNKQTPPKGYVRTCCRCKKTYTVDKKGLPTFKEECIYHPNNKYRIRGEVRYQCCSQDGTSDGCCIASSHVYEYVDFENLKGYVKTLPPEHDMDDYGVYSLDCEMCYTTQGLDLTRVTVINSACKVVYETLVKPLHPIIDYNTRYSGITEEQMSEVRTTLLNVQATLLTMFNSKTILIGHSLESDFKALKLIHDTVIDTSVLYPHKMGPPYKRALRNLSSEYLKKIIQNSVDGHDSAEDATVCMELLIYKVKEDLKTR